MAYPNELLKRDGVGNKIVAGIDDFSVTSTIESVASIRRVIEGTLAERSIMKNTSLPPEVGIAIRRMMASYWTNSSMFSMDLVGAVISQGSFVCKMHDIDWLHAPTAPLTMARLITKYEHFFQIMPDTRSKSPHQPWTSTSPDIRISYTLPLTTYIR